MLREVIRIGTIRTHRDGLSYWQQTNLLHHNETERWQDLQTRLSLCLNGKCASLNRDSEYFHYGKLLGQSRSLFGPSTVFGRVPWKVRWTKYEHINIISKIYGRYAWICIIGYNGSKIRFYLSQGLGILYSQSNSVLPLDRRIISALYPQKITEIYWVSK